MRDSGEDSGVHVGGDAPGEVRVTARRPRRNRTSVRSLIITGSLSALVLAGSGLAWALPSYVSAKVESVDAGTAGSSTASSGALNILLVGVDKRDDLTRQQQNQLHLGREVGQRTDTMMVIRLSQDHKKITVVSLPRDSWVDIPGKGTHKINSAYQFGGAKLAVRTVQQATGLRINHYIEVNVFGFINVVDALGGITVCTPVQINDDKTKLSMPPGTHQIPGITALAYARTRATARSDLDRIDRQQQVISALLNKALSGGTLTNPGKLTGFVSSMLDTLTVDEPLAKDVLGLATQLKDVSTDDVAFATVPLADVNYSTPTGESAVLWDKAQAREMFRRIGADQSLVQVAKPSLSAKPSASAKPSPTSSSVAPSSFNLRVMNGTLIEGLGARTRSALQEAGFKVPKPAGTTPRHDQQNTVVRYGPDWADEARAVAAVIPGAELEAGDVTGVQVVLGQRSHDVKKPGTPDPVVAKPSPTASPAARTATQNICKQS